MAALIGHAASRRLPLTAVLIAAAALIWGCAQPAPLPSAKWTGQAMGTTWSVTVVGALAATGDSTVPTAIAEQLAGLERELSHWREDSLVSRFNRQRSTEGVEISPALATVVQTAGRMHQATNGAFDITAAPLVDLWGFGPAGRHPAPSRAEVAAAQAHVDHDLLQLSQLAEGSWTLAKRDPQLQIDLSALAKGYAIDVLAESLNGRDCQDYLIELGGELRARGTNADGEAWHIGLERPDPRVVGEIRRTIRLRDMAVATSSNYRNFLVDQALAAEQRLPHVLDPRSGRPVDHALASVSVIAPTAMEADAWATALFVLGPQQGWELAARLRLAATFVSQQDGKQYERSTPAFTETVDGPQ